MHVVFVLPRFFPYRGGYENSLLTLAKYLVAQGHRSTVYTTVADDLEAFWLPGFKTFSEEHTIVDGVTIRRFPICYNSMRRRATRLLGAMPYWRWRAQHWRPSFRVPGLAEALRSVDADLIHIGPLPYNSIMYAGLHEGELRKIPVVCTPCSHLGVPGSSAIEPHYLGQHQVEMLRRCAKVFCMTRTERDHLAKLAVPESCLALASFGIDFGAVLRGDPEFLRHRYRVDGPAVLHLGMKAYDKGSQTLVEAMKMLWDKGSNAWLVMAGPSISTFDSYIAQAGKNCPKLVNLPPFADDEKRDLLASATVVAQPSRVESLGLVLIEAWAAAKPVIAGNIAVSRELISHTGGGLVVPFGDAQRLAEAIEGLLDDRRLRDQMGAAGRDKATQYDQNTCCERFAAEMGRLAAADLKQTQ